MITENIKLIHILADDEFNCRGNISAVSQDMLELARDIEANGLLQPVVVMPLDPPVGECTWKLLAGFRRFLAHRVLKREEIPAVIRQAMDETEALLLNLNENLKRKDLNVMQEARALQKFFNAGWTEAMIMARLGTTRGWTQIRVLALKLPPEIQAEIEAGLLSQPQIRELYELRGDKNLQFAAVRQIKDAKARGEKVNLKNKNKSTDAGENIVDVVSRPTKTELSKVVSHMVETLGSTLASRALAYAAGNIKFAEFEVDLVSWAAANGKTYKPFNVVAPITQ